MDVGWVLFCASCARLSLGEPEDITKDVVCGKIEGRRTEFSAEKLSE